MTEDATTYNEQVEEEQEYTIDMLERAMEKSAYVAANGLSGLLPFDDKGINKGEGIMGVSVFLALMSFCCAVYATYMGGSFPFYALAALMGAGAAAICFKGKQESYYKRIGYNFGVAAFVVAVSLAVL